MRSPNRYACIPLLLCMAVAFIWAASAGDVAAQAAEGGTGTWAFVHPPDTFRADAMLDLRYLNEKQAGETGFVHLSDDGASCVLGNGNPVRFWAVGSDVYRKTPPEMADHARFLAKLGVNMVRLHTQIAPPGPRGGLTDVNVKEIDGIWHMVAALKKEGIYVTLSPYWANAKDATQWGIEGYEAKTDLWGLLFFEPKLQEGYKAWVKALYARQNPYTGMTLANDPAVAIIQVQNEDGMFFWTMQTMKEPQVKRLGKLFGEWLIVKYGSLDKAKAAWSEATVKGDDLANGAVALTMVWDWTQPQTGGRAVRIADQLQFFAETQAKFYTDIAAYYRKDLGCKQIINASNWITADPIKLNDIERWTYTANDVIAVNKYFGGVHIGQNNGWRIDPGHYFTNKPATLNPRDLPTNLKQPVGHPMVITESSWVSPDADQTEGPFMIAAYQSITGVDAYYWFSATDVQYAPDPFLNFLNIKGQHPMFKWSCSIPAIMGNFPAAALLYRNSYLKTGAPVVHEERPLADLWNRKSPIIAEDKSFDPNRNKGNTGELSNIQKGVDPLAFLVGPVEVKYGGDPAKTTVADLSKYIDHDKKLIKSQTGEVTLDYGNGVCAIDSPKAQGASGFLKKVGEIKLSTITLQSANDQSSVLIVSMDDKPLAGSGKILVQVGTSVRPTGWKDEPTQFKSDDGKQTFDGFRIVSTGKMPWRVIDTNLTLTLRNPHLTKATLLDTAGYATGRTPISTDTGSVTLKLPPNAMYVVLE